MAILKIARMGHPVLRQLSAIVADPTAPEIRRLVGDMIETMADADGAGLAAPQVHAPVRVVVFAIPADRAADHDGADTEVPLTVMINPLIEPLTEDRDLGWEACLSLPGLAGQVQRYTRIRYRYLTPDGESETREADDYHARVVQHECDHLDGILYPMRIDDMSRFGFVEEMNAAAERARRAEAASRTEAASQAEAATPADAATQAKAASRAEAVDD